ncbi:MAG: hypothetical protein EPN30_08115 [Actinomycetota bacterium]|nr:MAG: hypothetical protein EPN30_08115 [Actinomycetota bacterium]
MRRRRMILGATGLAAAGIVGIGAATISSAGSSLASSSVPTTQVASPSNNQSTNSTAHPRRHMGFGRFGFAVYSETVVPQKSGSGYETIISVTGKLSNISSGSISVVRADTGATVTAAITSSTRFGNTTEAALASDLSSKTAVTVRLVETGGNAIAIGVPPTPGTGHGARFGHYMGSFPPPRVTAPNSSANA